MQRLNRPLTKLATFTGPVAIGQFEDGTLCIAGPNDPPIIIRNGTVLKVDPNEQGEVDGDIVFRLPQFVS